MASSEDNGQAGKPDLNENQWAALEIELRSIEAGNWKAGSIDPASGDWTGIWPSSQSASWVAQQ
ncbi:MAG: hypothetical protein QF393_07430, partial [Rhodospirillales bacterium]|nr:hypothetical protein [Rhodospirillales bacterium]